MCKNHERYLITGQILEKLWFSTYLPDCKVETKWRCLSHVSYQGIADKMACYHTNNPYHADS